MNCKKCLHYEACTANLSPLQCILYRDKDLYVKRDEKDDIVKFTKLINKWYDFHENYLKNVSAELQDCVKKRMWQPARDDVEISHVLDDLINDYGEMWDSEFTLYCYEMLSFHFKKDVREILAGLSQAYGQCVLANNKSALVEVYKDFILLFETAYVMEGKRTGAFRFLLCRFSFWRLKKRYVGRSDDGRS